MAEKAKAKPQDPCGSKIKCKYLTIGGTRYRTLYTEKFKNRVKWEAPDPSKILAVIPGTIKEIFVKEGQKVNEGDPLVTLEAMKMRNIIVAESPGVVRKLNVENEQRVPKGHMLVHLEH